MNIDTSKVINTKISPKYFPRKINDLLIQSIWEHFVYIIYMKIYFIYIYQYLYNS